MIAVIFWIYTSLNFLNIQTSFCLNYNKLLFVCYGVRSEKVRKVDYRRVRIFAKETNFKKVVRIM